MQTDNLDYFRHRAQEERLAAMTCEDDAAAAAHVTMANEYQRRVDKTIDRPPLVRVR